MRQFHASLGRFDFLHVGRKETNTSEERPSRRACERDTQAETGCLLVRQAGATCGSPKRVRACACGGEIETRTTLPDQAGQCAKHPWTRISHPTQPHSPTRIDGRMYSFPNGSGGNVWQPNDITLMMEHGGGPRCRRLLVHQVC